MVVFAGSFSSFSASVFFSSFSSSFRLRLNVVISQEELDHAVGYANLSGTEFCVTSLKHQAAKPTRAKPTHRHARDGHARTRHASTDAHKKNTFHVTLCVTS